MPWILQLHLPTRPLFPLAFPLALAVLSVVLCKGTKEEIKNAVKSPRANHKRVNVFHFLPRK